MGLDAYVPCNCFRDGLAAPPPFPADLITVGEGGKLDVTLPERTSEWFHRYSDWLESACAHRGMRYAAVRVGNWWAYGDFKAALEGVGWEYFPALQEELPEGNGGWASPEAAARMLDELALFRQQSDLGGETVLLDSASGAVIWQYRGGSPLMSWDDPPGVNLGLDERGFFAVASGAPALDSIVQTALPANRPKQQPGAELFRSMRFEQRQMIAKGDRQIVRFVDTASGTTFVSSSAVEMTVPCPDDQVRRCTELPRALHVEQRRYGAESLEAVVNAVETVCRAAIATGNHIFWT